MTYRGHLEDITTSLLLRPTNTFEKKSTNKNATFLKDFI